MSNIQIIFRQAALALVLCGASLAAHAGLIPASFRVSINTAGMPAAQFLDMTFNSFGGAASATATISNLQGAFGGVDSFEGAVGNPAAGVFTIGNDAGWNYLSHHIVAGGMLSFDVAFGGAFLAEVEDYTSIFSAALLDVDYAPLGNEEGDIIFSVTRLGIGVDVNADLATVTAVPEPSELLLMLTGLALIGSMARRRQR